MDFIRSNLGNIIVGAILVLIVGLIIKSLKKSKGGCSGCSNRACPKFDEKK